MAECKTVYIVLPCFNEEAVICETMKQVREKLMGMIGRGFISDNSRMCFVNDGSSDNTWDIIRDNCLKDKYMVLAAGEISHPQTNQNDQLGTG